MILGRDLLTALGLDIKVSENIFIIGEGPYEGCSAPMVDVINYDLKPLTAKIVKQEKSFINAYVENASNMRAQNLQSAGCAELYMLSTKILT